MGLIVSLADKESDVNNTVLYIFFKHFVRVWCP